MKKIRVLVLRTAGTNCDMETAFAFEEAGASPDLVHINELNKNEKRLDAYSILAIPGGFTYGDDIASGKILANELRFKLESEIQRFINDGKLVIGICNGFQVLVKSAFLPNIHADFKKIEATLTLNDSGRFEDRWIYLKPVKGRCVWTNGINRIIQLPVAHGEGKFIPCSRSLLGKLEKKGLIVFKYTDDKGRSAAYPANPNGSVYAIAGICDTTGRVFGLMPHPERHIYPHQHPSWTRAGLSGKGDGFSIFKNGVDFAKKHL